MYQTHTVHLSPYTYRLEKERKIRSFGCSVTVACDSQNYFKTAAVDLMVSLRPGRWWWIFFKSKAINSEVNRNTETVIRSFLAAVGVGEYESP